MKLKNKEITKGIVFAGCSFTWGQGLYYYSNLPTLEEPPPDAYNPRLVTDAHNSFRKTLYYPRLVANYFNTFEIVSKQNGGSEESSLEFLNELFTGKKNYTHLTNQYFKYEEIEYIILQTSQIVRNSFEFNYKNKIYKFLPWDVEESKMFYEWLEENNIKFEDWAKKHYTNTYNTLKSHLQFYESKGIKILLLSWEEDYLNLIKNDDWFVDKFIPMKYNNVNYMTIRNLMNQNKNLHINSDYEYFEDTPKDHHPSKYCHEIIAENIINKIEEIKNKK